MPAFSQRHRQIRKVLRRRNDIRMEGLVEQQDSHAACITGLGQKKQRVENSDTDILKSVKKKMPILRPSVELIAENGSEGGCAVETTSG